MTARRRRGQSFFLTLNNGGKSLFWPRLFQHIFSQITEEELNAGKSTDNATSVANVSNLSQTDNDNTAIDESDLFGALSESDEEPQVKHVRDLSIVLFLILAPRQSLY
jgi:hypothetical protein